MLVDASNFAELEFQFQLRKYQRMILNLYENSREDMKLHIVAPPGSGKTIVGLEIILRERKPSVIFAPTTTIQLQWRERVKMFLPSKSANRIDDIVSLNPKNISLFNVYTYQLISTRSENIKFVEDVAVQEWAESMFQNNIVSTIEEARMRIQSLKVNNNKEYSREISRHYKKIKDRLLRDSGFDGTQFLHENARELIDRLVEKGIKIVVLDEVHHLLDYWALVIKELIKRIEGVKIIGLTATPPFSKEAELENYLSIVGDIDFEVPTPAVVKEGSLSPYQDLVYLCTPTAKEKLFIKDIQEIFLAYVSDMSKDPDFLSWIERRILDRTDSGDDKQEWADFLNNNLFLGIAGVKFLIQVANRTLPDDIVPIREMYEKISFDDWAYLLTDYCLNYLKTSKLQRHHEKLKLIRNVLRPLGFTLTERGLRRHRSPGDRILAFSMAKNHSLVKVLQAELDSMGESLRVVVITDFEKLNPSLLRGVRGVLDSEAGGAVGAFRATTLDPITTILEPILVTGTTVMIDADKEKTILQKMRDWLKENNVAVNLETEKTKYEKILQLKGTGSEWKSRTWVRMITDLFEKGVTQCIVGTRSLLGEGWDSLSLNTLIDMTQATTSTTVNQIRGRPIRLDPNRPRKVANIWDIVCIYPMFEKGDQDFLRFVKKHSHHYGIIEKGRIVKGLSHVSEDLEFLYGLFGLKKISIPVVNEMMLGDSRNREAIYERWNISEDYSNFEYTATKLDSNDFKFKTVFTLKDSLKAIFNNIMIAIIVFSLYYFAMFSELLFSNIGALQTLFLTGLLIGALLFSLRNIWRFYYKAFVELPVDSFLLDIGKAVHISLRETGIIASSQSVDNVRIVEGESGYYDVFLDYATQEDSRQFSQAYKEVISPVIDQRYLVSRSDDNIKIGFYSPLWWLLRKIFRFIKQEHIAYHPVPSELSINQNLAKIFFKNWSEYVGGNELLYTRTTKGRELLLKLRSKQMQTIKNMNYDIWK